MKCLYCPLKSESLHQALFSPELVFCCREGEGLQLSLCVLKLSGGSAQNLRATPLPSPPRAWLALLCWGTRLQPDPGTNLAVLVPGRWKGAGEHMEILHGDGLMKITFALLGFALRSPVWCHSRRWGRRTRLGMRLALRGGQNPEWKWLH